VTVKLQACAGVGCGGDVDDYEGVAYVCILTKNGRSESEGKYIILHRD